MIYARDFARIIIGNCSTRIAFAEQDPEIAKTFGENETEELKSQFLMEPMRQEMGPIFRQEIKLLQGSLHLKSSP